mmetsp:Transcript_12922/g.13371  ORF Transcript_12922/g.13371 Transcript_12922/m.13371 type:complete len:442 (+) Transcript_12922:74-1399(+)
MGAYCSIYLGLEDTHGSYNTWTTSFIKYEGIFHVEGDNDDNGPDDDAPSYKIGYIYAPEAVSTIPIGTGDEEFAPLALVSLFPNRDATFSIVPGKLDSNGDLIPCDIDSPGSGPCFTSRSWEISFGARDFWRSFVGSDANTWISPVGGSFTASCRPDTVSSTFGHAYPVSLTSPARSSNNVKPPNYHVKPPLPHESTEFFLTLTDPSGQGWWNVIKFFPNQYILDDGENILHRGTLVDKAQTTEKFSLKEGTYYLRFQGNHDVDAFDDTWTLATKDGTIASGGRYDRVTLTVGNGAAVAEVENIRDRGEPFSNSYTLGKFNGLLNAKILEEQRHKIFQDVAESETFKSLSGHNFLKDAATTMGSSKPTLSSGISANPLATAGLVVASAFMGVGIMLGIMSFLRANKKNYNPVMDISTNNNNNNIEIEFEKTNNRIMKDCPL